MISCPIYDKNGVVKNAVIDTLELHDEWMAECYVTVSVKSPVPIDFEIGDYILYRGEQYTIQYSPNLLKKAASGSYQEGFVYDNIKFVGSQDDVVRCDFNDIVLNDNEMHYTALSTFPFYCESVDDLLDRIQANLEDLYPGQWIIIGLNTVRNYQRGTAVGRVSAFDEAYRTYIDPTGTAKTDPYGKQGVAESVDNITCWDAMKKVHDDFDLNFIVRGRVIIVGTAGVFTANTFRYGKGNGLYEIERVGDSDQQIVTRLRAYGSETNLPSHYYATLNKQVYATVTTIKNKFGTTGADFLLDLDFNRKYFTYRSESYPGTTESPNYIIEMMANDVAVRGYVTKDSITGKCYVYCESVAGDDDRDEPDATKMAAFVQALTENDRLDFVDYVNKDTFGEGHYDYSSENLPDNMAVSRLMLPGFPNQSLDSWVQAHKNLTGFEWLAQAVADGFTFSTDKYRPYIDSPNISQYGVRPASIYFDGSDETDDIHPTIEGMEHDNAPVDEVYAADQVEDNGVYPAGDEVKNINITLPDLGFELDKVYEDGASIDMKNGMCGARSFKIAKKPTKDANNRWVCNVERVHDESLDLWFPYCDFQIHGSSEQGREHGDKYVLTGITMPDAYIDFAAVKLLRASIEALKKNHAPRYTYQPRIDEIFMQRQHDTAISSQGVVSLHDTLKAGDIFSFADDDLNIDANIIIDVLTIKENGNNGIPTYEVTLRDEKQVGTIQKITNKVESIISGATSINGATGGLSVQQVRSIINNFGGSQFLSKLNDDTAQGFITMLKGLQVGNQFVSGLLGEGGVLRMDADGKTYLEADKMYIRMRAYFDTVEVREYKHSAGNRVASPAGAKCVRVAWFNSSNEELEQTQENLSSVACFRCYFRADDGEDTVRNNFVVGDQVYCHITTVNGADDNPSTKGLNQKHYWRLCIGKNTDNNITEDGEGWIDLSNRSTETISSHSYTGYQANSDVPEPQDSMVQLGNVNDTTRQGAIIEFVTGADAPSYQIYQGINSFSLTGRNMITLGYNSATGRAELKVYGDAFIGDPNRTTYIEYVQDDGTDAHAPKLKIKAEVEFTNSQQDLDNFVQSHQRNYDDTEVRGLIDGLQDQIDGQVESWFYNYAPVHIDEHGAPDSRVPLNIAPYSDWTTEADKIAHLGDTFTDNSTGYCWRFSRNEDTNAFEWVVIEDSALISALQKASKAQETADNKRRVFLVQPTPPYDAGDLWVNATYPANYTGATDEANHKYNNDILKCVIAKASGSAFSIDDWKLSSKYTDDTKFNGYISALLNDTGLSGDAAAAAAQRAVLSALGVGTVVSGGLLLTSLIGMRQYKNNGGDKSDIKNYTTWAGISGEYNANVKGGGIAAWYGGGMVDHEVNTTATDYAKSLFRFDGSGYMAGGNITWDAQGRVAIKDITTLIAGSDTNILNALTTFNNAFHFNTQQGSSTILSISPQAGFDSLSILENGTLKPVATQEWANRNFVTKTFFDSIFRLYNGTTKINVNDTIPSSNNLNIEAMFGFWTKKYISALGQGDDGSTSYSTLAALNDVTLTNPTANQILKYDGTHWVNAAAPTTYVLPTATDNTLGGIKVGYTTSGKNYALQLDANGKAYVNVPWSDTTYTLPTASASVLGGVKVGTTLAIANGVLNLKSGIATAGTYRSVTVDTYGRVTAGTNPTTIAGYGITDAYTKAEVDSLARLESVAFSSDGVLAFTLQDGSVSYVDLTHQHDFQEILERPTTIAGFGINDAKIENGVITLGNNTITPVTSVAMTVPTGFSISGTPISKNGTLALSYSSGYEGFTTELKNMITALYSWFEVDSNGDIKTKDYTSNGTTKHRGFWSPSFISALGQGSDSGGGGQGDVTWELLKNQATDDRYIHLSYISDALESYLTTNNYVQSSDISDMATKTWVGNQGYLTQQSLSSYYTKPEVDALSRLTNVAYSSDGILALTHQDGSTTYADFTHEHSFLELLDRPTTIAGYEISDIYINSGVVYIGDSSITPVTSVAMTVPTGFSISGSPISKTGTLAVSYASGYEGFTTSLKEKIEALFSWFELDSEGNVKTKDYVDNGTTKHRGFWSESFISALGEGNDGGGGGQGDVTWELLAKQATNNRTIHQSYIADILSSYATTSWVTGQNYATQTWVDGKGYATTSQLNALEFLSAVTGGDGVVTITTNKNNSTILDLSHEHSFLELLDRPTTVDGYGITDAVKSIMVGEKSYTSTDGIITLPTYYITTDSRAANTVLAAPNGASGAATFRALVAADIPALTKSKISDFPTTWDWSNITNKPTTWAWTTITGKPTTIAGYGITDAKIVDGVITLGAVNITPITSVAMTVPSGFSISGSPISKAGTLALSYASGYEGFTTELKNKINSLFSWFEVDSSGNVKTKDYTENGTTKHRGFYSPSFVSALGQGDDGQSGVGDVTWELLAASATGGRTIHLSYISSALASYLTSNSYIQSSAISDMATKTWVGQQGYLKQASLSNYYTKSEVYTKTEVNALTRVKAISASNDGLTFTWQDDTTTIADFSHEHSFLELLDRPSTIAGYGISLTADDIPNLPWGKITSGKPTTVSGYGIADAVTSVKIGTNSYAPASGIVTLPAYPTNYYSNTDSHTANTVLAAPNGSSGVATFRSLVAADIPTLTKSKISDFPTSWAWSALTGVPTTIAGYGITDAHISNGVITLGANTITPITSVAMTVPTGFSVSGSPISKTGTLAVSYASGYEGFTTTLKDKINLLYSLFTREGSGTSSDPYVIKANYGLYTEKFLSALGQGDDGQSGVGDVTWELLATQATNNRTIHSSYISSTLAAYATQNWVSNQNYATQTWVTGKNYATQSWVSGLGYATQSWVTSQGYATTSNITTAINALTYFNAATVVDGCGFKLSGHGVGDVCIDLTHEHSWFELLDRPSTLAGLGVTITASDIPNLDWSKITTGKPTTLAGYGIADAVASIVINGTSYLPSNKVVTLPVYTSTQVDALARLKTLALTNNGVLTFTHQDNSTSVVDFSHEHSFLELVDRPTTIKGYGITILESDVPNLPWSKITSGKPTTVAGYGITDAITTGNIGNQSVNYATTAGGVSWANVSNKPSAAGNGTTPVYWTGSGFTACTPYSSASVNYANSAGSASQLSTPRTLWGQSFNGTGNVSGSLSGVGHLSFGADNTYDVGASGTRARSGYFGTYLLCDAIEIGHTNEINTTSGVLYLQYRSPATNLVLCYNGGNVGVGNSSPSYRLDVSGVIYSNTGVYSAGYVTALSDARHKTIVRNTNISVEQIAAMRSVVYRWNDRNDDKLYVGSIAQDWQGVLPQVVSVADDKEHTLGLQYGVAALVAAITTARKVVEHEERIKALERENADLKQAYSFIKNAYEELKLKIA